MIGWKRPPETHGRRTLDVPGGVAQEFAGMLYGWIGRVAAVVAFAAVWIGAGVEWGPLVGLAVGWFPAAIAALLARYLWPVALVAGLLLRHA